MANEKSDLKWNKIILVFQVIIAFSSLFATIYFSQQNLELVNSSRRADLSIFLTCKPGNYQSNWTREYNVSGEIVNEGTRDTAITRILIILDYKPYNHTVTSVISDPHVLNWSDMIVNEEDVKEFDCKILGQGIQISENSQSRWFPDFGLLIIEHYDGKGKLEQSIDFEISYH